jgi:coenzyme F420 hydrogenase subunit beta
MHDDIKTFKDLEREVQNRGICGKCGGCVSFCSAGEFNALRTSGDGTPYFADESKCVSCGICYLICPHIKTLNGELKAKYNWKAPCGYIRNLTIARTTDKKIAKAATDGGVVTSLLVYAMKKGFIQGAIVSKKTGPFSRQPLLVTEVEELIEAAGMNMDDTKQLDEMAKSYSTFSPGVKELKKVGSKKKIESIALVGTPCVIYTVRKMQLLKVIPADVVTLTIGLFCMENFSFDATARRKLEKKIGVDVKNIEKLNIKDDVIITRRGGEQVHVPFEDIDEIARKACFACPDFSADFADISCGGLGSPEGYTTTVLRTTAGERIFNGAKNEKFIEELKTRSKDEFSDRKTEAMAKITSFSARKKKRAEKTLKAN